MPALVVPATLDNPELPTPDAPTITDGQGNPAKVIFTRR